MNERHATRRNNRTSRLVADNLFPLTALATACPSEAQTGTMTRHEKQRQSSTPGLLPKRRWRVKMSVIRRVHFIRMGSSLALLFAFVSFGSAQSSLMTTYVGPSLPVSGSPALTQAIDGPVSVTPDGAGGFYAVSRNQNQVYRVTSGGTLTVIAGTSYGFSGDGGPATLAQLASPSSVAMDSTGNLYIADTGNQRIRKITSKGVISTVTGTGVAGFSGDGGAATIAQVSSPGGVAVDGSNNLYIADTNNYRVRKVSASGMISTVAGNGATGGNGPPFGGAASGAQIGMPYSVAVDPSGNLYIGDTLGIQRVSSGIITTVVLVFGGRNGGCQFVGGDGGPAISASVCLLRAMAFDTSGNLYIADPFQARIREGLYRRHDQHHCRRPILSPRI